MTSSTTQQTTQQTKRNRRFAYLSRLHSDPSSHSTSDPSFFFSDSAIRSRAPHLFDNYISRYIPPSEKQKPFEASVKLVDRMYFDMDEREYLEALGVDMEGNEIPLDDLELREEEEFDSDDEEGRLNYQDTLRRQKVQRALNRSLGQTRAPTGKEEYQEVSVEERQRLREELVTIMKERFLDGGDAEFFDYSFVDDDEELDDLKVMERDVQERYFDGMDGDSPTDDVENGQIDTGSSSMSVENDGRRIGSGNRRTKQEWANVWDTQGSVNDAEYDY
ncbi:hypothetical protein BCR33DRAFT_721798 [Rhizoclosmatium globosum]|uniref:CCD97-like C-terminal domain-containing protein n=1 Tax=Rhizoclosmatium globosum TaxID=329046 RepID=A0A1Y2BQ40_9FUNG|nr:hypothetical protein BCR33DRAFT_721798 [Rhizoclosmatium globosum]|eukprot:ORY36871.1 hypothetical protein BCR33DRAFT_721798 [Rhizoclosmatium globosum]